MGLTPAQNAGKNMTNYAIKHKKHRLTVLFLYTKFSQNLSLKRKPNITKQIKEIFKCLNGKQKKCH